MGNRLEIIHQKLIDQILVKRPRLEKAWGLWIRQYPPISVDADNVDYRAFPQKVWFVEGSEVRQENVWKWMRLIAAQELAPIWYTDHVFSIAQAAFAPYSESEDYYVEVWWGCLWGEAWRVSIGPEGQPKFLKELWKA